MSFLTDDFLLRILLAGLGVTVAAGPLGSFVVWRRMAYFGDATTHAAILGIAFALAFEFSIFLGAMATSLAMALTVTALSGRHRATDTSLGVLSHGALAIGLVAVSLIGGVRFELSAFLFGDLLSVRAWDVGLIWGGAVLVTAWICFRWSALLTSTLSPELAQAAGINPRAEQLALNVALALTVAVAIKVVGVLLIAALLIIPAAAARAFSDTPERMAVVATGIGMGSVGLGLWSALQFDTPAGPSIACAAALVFSLSLLVQMFRSSS